MHTTDQHRWTISGIDDVADHRSGNAGSLSDAWTAALTAGLDALLATELETLAVRINDELEALYSPGRDDAGMLDQPEITADFVEMLQDVAAAALADELGGLITQIDHAGQAGGDRSDFASPPA